MSWSFSTFKWVDSESIWLFDSRKWIKQFWVAVFFFCFWLFLFIYLFCRRILEIWINTQKEKINVGSDSQNHCWYNKVVFYWALALYFLWFLHECIFSRANFLSISFLFVFFWFIGIVKAKQIANEPNVLISLSSGFGEKPDWFRFKVQRDRKNKLFWLSEGSGELLKPLKYRKLYNIGPWRTHLLRTFSRLVYPQDRF